MIWKELRKHVEYGGKVGVGELQEWLSESDRNMELYKLYQSLKEDNNTIPDFSPDKSEAWNRISARIGRNPGRVLKLWVLRVSAAVIVFALGYALHLVVESTKPVNLTEVVAPLGQKCNILLPDGSKATLNGGTHLKYPDRFNGKLVELQLTGEAFFEVSKNSRRSFVVNASPLSIKVHGTSFNIKSYDNDENIEVALQEGSISIYTGEKYVTSLSPCQMASYIRSDGKLYIKRENIDVITAWKNNELIFDNTPFGEVVKYLARFYGVEIEMAPELAEKHYFTFKLKTESMRETLMLLSQIAKFEYTINGKDIRISPCNKKQTNQKTNAYELTKPET